MISKYEFKVQRFPIYLITRYMHCFPHYQHLALEWYILLQSLNLYWLTHKVLSLHYSSLMVLCILWVLSNEYIMHPTWEYFTVLKILCALTIFSFSPNHLETIDLLTTSIVFSFTKFHIIGIIKHITFS